LLLPRRFLNTSTPQVAEFTIKSLQSWQWASGSVYYLLGLWSRLVSSMPYLKGDSPSLLEGYVPKITEAYITSRLDSVQVRAVICLMRVARIGS
jgi:hypothetical protein